MRILLSALAAYALVWGLYAYVWAPTYARVAAGVGP